MLPFGQLKVTTWETDQYFSKRIKMVITNITTKWSSRWSKQCAILTNQVGSGVRIGRRGEKLNLTESSSILKVVLFNLISDGG